MRRGAKCSGTLTGIRVGESKNGYGREKCMGSSPCRWPMRVPDEASGLEVDGLDTHGRHGSGLAQ